MLSLLDFFITASFSYASYLWFIISNPFAKENYFYLLIGLSLLVWCLEMVFPWRKDQPVIRKGFYLDTFFIFFNFFLFNLVFFIAFSNLTELYFHKFLHYINVPIHGIISLNNLPILSQILIYFLLADFLQWAIHRFLHNNKFLWKFHKVHHSVTEMNFAAHFRFHFVEHFIYKGGLYLLLSWLINFELKYVFYIHALNILIGHLNHSNLNINYGVFKYVFNNPKLHIWHHSKTFPKRFAKGANFAISLSIWDYLFKTVYMPSDGKSIKLGFENIEKYPQTFVKLMKEPFKSNTEL